MSGPSLEKLPSNQDPWRCHLNQIFLNLFIMLPFTRRAEKKVPCSASQLTGRLSATWHRCRKC
eukprot:5391115-Amphidinium_carterae.1